MSLNQSVANFENGGWLGARFSGAHAVIARGPTIANVQNVFLSSDKFQQGR